MLSVIIPVYKTMDYLEQCVKSVLAQDYDDMEVILVNDCSPDDSGLLCDKLAELNPRIKVIHKPVNEGLGFARNTGMEQAKGDFYTFIDSDDYLQPDAFRPMMEHMLQEDLDIIQAKMIIDYDDCDYRSPDSGRLITFTREEALDSHINYREIENVACNKIYKVRIFNKIRFSNTPYNEDFEIMDLLLYESNKIGFYDKSLYHYRQRSDSLMKQPPTIGRAMFNVNVFTKRSAFLKLKNQKLYLAARQKEFAHMVRAYHLVDRNQPECEDFKQKLRIETKEIFKEVAPYLTIKRKFRFKLLLRSLKTNGVDSIILRRLMVRMYKMHNPKFHLTRNLIKHKK